MTSFSEKFDSLFQSIFQETSSAVKVELRSLLLEDPEIKLLIENTEAKERILQDYVRIHGDLGSSKIRQQKETAATEFLKIQEAIIHPSTNDIGAKISILKGIPPRAQGGKPPKELTNSQRTKIFKEVLKKVYEPEDRFLAAHALILSRLEDIGRDKNQSLFQDSRIFLLSIWDFQKKTDDIINEFFKILHCPNPSTDIPQLLSKFHSTLNQLIESKHTAVPSFLKVFLSRFTIGGANIDGSGYSHHFFEKLDDICNQFLDRNLEQILEFIPDLKKERLQELFPKLTLDESNPFDLFKKAQLLARYNSKALDPKYQEMTTSFLNHNISEEYLNPSLAFMESPHTTIKSEDFLPNIKVEKTVLEGSTPVNYTFERIQPGDYRAMFLGQLTDCCQSIGDHSERCVQDGLTKPSSSFYVLSRNGKIIAQSYAWISRDDNIVFDSIEVFKYGAEGDSIYSDITQEMAILLSKEIVKSTFKEINPLDHSIIEKPVHRVLLGTGGGTPTVFKSINASDIVGNTSIPLPGTFQYGDSKSKILIAAHDTLVDRGVPDSNLSHEKLIILSKTDDEIISSLSESTISLDLFNFALFFNKSPQIINFLIDKIDISNLRYLDTYLIAKKQPALLEKLVARGLDINIHIGPYSYGESGLKKSINEKDYSAAVLFLKLGATISQQQLITEAQMGRIDIFMLLAKEKPELIQSDDAINILIQNIQYSPANAQKIIRLMNALKPLSVINATSLLNTAICSSMPDSVFTHIFNLFKDEIIYSTIDNKNNATILLNMMSFGKTTNLDEILERTLTANPALINHKNSKDQTALTLALKNHHYDLAQRLFAHDLIDISQGFVIHEAISQNYIELAERMIDKIDESSKSALIAKNNDGNVLSILIDSQQNAGINEALCLKIINKNPIILLDNVKGQDIFYKILENYSSSKLSADFVIQLIDLMISNKLINDLFKSTVSQRSFNQLIEKIFSNLKDADIEVVFQLFRSNPRIFSTSTISSIIKKLLPQEGSALKFLGLIRENPELFIENLSCFFDSYELIGLEAIKEITRIPGFNTQILINQNTKRSFHDLLSNKQFLSQKESIDFISELIKTNHSVFFDNRDSSKFSLYRTTLTLFNENKTDELKFLLDEISKNDDLFSCLIASAIDNDDTPAEYLEILFEKSNDQTKLNSIFVMTDNPFILLNRIDQLSKKIRIPKDVFEVIISEDTELNKDLLFKLIKKGDFNDQLLELIASKTALLKTKDWLLDSIFKSQDEALISTVIDLIIENDIEILIQKNERNQNAAKSFKSLQGVQINEDLFFKIIAANPLCLISADSSNNEFSLIHEIFFDFTMKRLSEDFVIKVFSLIIKNKIIEEKELADLINRFIFTESILSRINSINIPMLVIENYNHLLSKESIVSLTTTLINRKKIDFLTSTLNQVKIKNPTLFQESLPQILDSFSKDPNSLKAILEFIEPPLLLQGIFEQNLSASNTGEFISAEKFSTISERIYMILHKVDTIPGLFEYLLNAQIDDAVKNETIKQCFLLSKSFDDSLLDWIQKEIPIDQKIEDLSRSNARLLIDLSRKATKEQLKTLSTSGYSSLLMALAIKNHDWPLILRLKESHAILDLKNINLDNYYGHPDFFKIIALLAPDALNKSHDFLSGYTPIEAVLKRRVPGIYDDKSTQEALSTLIESGAHIDISKLLTLSSREQFLILNAVPDNYFKNTMIHGLYTGADRVTLDLVLKKGILPSEEELRFICLQYRIFTAYDENPVLGQIIPRLNLETALKIIPQIQDAESKFINELILNQVDKSIIIEVINATPLESIDFSKIVATYLSEEIFSKLVDKIKTDESFKQKIKIGSFISACTEEQLNYLSRLQLLIITQEDITNALLIGKNESFLQSLIASYLNQEEILTPPPPQRDQSSYQEWAYSEDQAESASFPYSETDENNEPSTPTYPVSTYGRSLFFMDSEEDEEDPLLSTQPEKEEVENIATEILAKYSGFNLELLLGLIEKDHLPITRKLIEQIEIQKVAEKSFMLNIIEKWSPIKEQDRQFKETLLIKYAESVAQESAAMIFSSSKPSASDSRPSLKM